MKGMLVLAAEKLRLVSVSVWAVAIVVNLVWAATFVSTQVLLRTFSPFEIQFMRYLIAWAVLWVVGPRFWRVKSTKDHLVFLGMGVVGVAIYQLLENVAVAHLNATSTGILMSLGPLFSVCALAIFGSRLKMSVRFVAGAAVACMGAALACMSGVPPLDFPVRGTMAALGAMMCWCTYAVGSDYLAKKGYGSMQIVRSSFFWSVMLSFLIFSMKLVMNDGCSASDVIWSFLARFDGKAVVNLLVLGVMASAVCFVLWERIGISHGYGPAVIMLYLSPICTIIIATLVFGKLAPLEEWVGAVISVIGIAIALNGWRGHPWRVAGKQLRKTDE